MAPDGGGGGELRAAVLRVLLLLDGRRARPGARPGIDANRRHVYFVAGCLGGLIGAPAVVANVLLTREYSKDWLLRTDNFLPIARFSELLFPRTAIVVAVVALAWAVSRRRDLLYLACVCAAGLLLLNHQVVTGLQIQNFHWNYAWGPCGSLLVVLLAAGAVCPVLAQARRDLGSGRRLRRASGRGLLAPGRGVGQDRAIPGDPRRLRPIPRPAAGPRRPRFPANAVIAGDPVFTEMAIALENVRPLVQYCTLFSPYVSTQELGDRQALDAVLAGVEHSDFAAKHENELGTGWGPWQRNRKLRPDRVAELLRAYDSAAADPSPGLDRFHVRLVARSDASPPPGPGWRALDAGPSWHLWERAARPPR